MDNEKLRVELTNLEIDLRQIAIEGEEIAAETSAITDKTELLGYEERIEKLKESKLKRLTKADLVALVLEQNELIMDREDGYGTMVKESVEHQMCMIDPWMLGARGVFQSKLDDFRRRIL